MNDIKHKTIGVIGYGNFGKVLCNNIFPNNKIVLYTKNQSIQGDNVIVVNAIEALVKQADIVIPAVPIREFEQVVKQIASHATEETTIMDVCSVKKYPAKIMQSISQTKVKCIATHPMFGPNSIEKRNGDVTDLKIVIHNISASNSEYESIKEYLQSLHLDVIEMNPEEHDKIAAHSQFFAMIVGQLAQSLGIKPTIIDTPGEEKIVEALQYMGKDKTIIEDMITYNNYCKEVLYTMQTMIHQLMHI